MLPDTTRPGSATATSCGPAGRLPARGRVARRAAGTVAVALVIGTQAPAAHAAITGHTAPGDAVPPPTSIGGVPVTAFPEDPSSPGTWVLDMPTPLGGTVGFSRSGQRMNVTFGLYRQFGWEDGGALRLRLPTGTSAFSGYVRPNQGTSAFVATAQDGTTATTDTARAGDPPRYVGFVATGGDRIRTIEYALSQSSANGFVLGGFTIARSGPLVTVTTPSLDGEYARGSTVPADYACERDPAGGEPDLAATNSCVGTVADGAAIDTATLGPKSFVVTVRDAAGRVETEELSYTVVDATDPSVTIETPTDGQTLQRDETLEVAFSCADDVGGSGIAVVDGCVGSIEHPDGTTTPIVDGGPLPTSALGGYELAVTATDEVGNTTTRTAAYTVLAPPPPPVAAPPPAPVVVPAPPVTTIPASPAPVLPLATCPVRGVQLVGIAARGTASRPTVRLTGIADRSLTGASVVVRGNERKIATSRVRGDGTIQVSVGAPRNRRAREQARYRLVVGTRRTFALKTTRAVTISDRRTLASGSVRVQGALVGVRGRRTLTVQVAPLCGPAPSVARRVRTDAAGRFRVVLARPAAGGAPLVYRIRAARRTFTLPLVVTAP